MRIAISLSGAGLLALLATGCLSPSAERAIDGPMYPAGYADGCESAREAERAFSTKVVRDARLFENDASYRTGWRQGYAACLPATSQVDPNRNGNNFEPF